MKASLIVVCSVLAATGALAQKMSLAPESFLKDINSLAGVSRIGSALLAAAPDKKKWGDYCTASQGLARQGEFRKAIRSAAKALYLGESAHGNWGAPLIYSSNDIATAYSYAGDHDTAAVWADKALAAIGKGYDSSVREGVLLITANARRIKALALSHAGRHTEAIAELQKGIDALPSFGASDPKLEMHIALVSLYTKAGMFDKAGDLIGKVLAQLDVAKKVSPHRAAGDLALAKKDAAAALGYYTTAMKAATERNEPFQASMVHLGLARAARLKGDDAMASAELTQALAGLERLRNSFSSSEMRTALYGNLQSVFDEAVDFFDAHGDADKALAASEASRARAMLDLQRKVEFAAGVAAPAVRPRALGDIQSGLATGQTMVVYHQLTGKLVAWVVTRDALRHQPLPMTAEQTQKQVAALRVAIERADTTALPLAQALYKQLLEPLQVAGTGDIVFVPHKSLHLLPFQALHDGSQWLIEKHAVATALSASLFETAAQSDAAPRLAALGNPDLGKPEWALPGSEAEVKAIQPLYADGSVYVQKEATKVRLTQIAPGAQVVHIAAHAVVDDIDPMYSTIKLATATPMDAMASPDMEAREFAGLNLHGARLVSLSACNSGVGKVADGDEFMGFKRALFTAGAQSALVSLWPVEDESTQMLMTEFHHNWKSVSKARAMQAAQLKVLSNPKYASPFYWAAFTLVGDPG